VSQRELDRTHEDLSSTPKWFGQSLYRYPDGLPVVLSPEQCMAVDWAIRNYTEHVVVTENRTPDPPEIAHWFRQAVVMQRGPMYDMLIKGELPQ
jgi:hypothetical protein